MNVLIAISGVMLLVSMGLYIIEMIIQMATLDKEIAEAEHERFEEYYAPVMEFSKKKEEA